MGAFHDGNPPSSFHADDQILAHLELVITAKLRRQQRLPFALTGPNQRWLQAMRISPVTLLRSEHGAPMSENNKP